jgi:uncharacterized protein YeaO (DUF488 family)
LEAVLRVKRIYENPSKEDGRRILVDRVWPRGFTKERARVDEWRKDLAPSDALRKWFGHDLEKWEEFRRRYRAELREVGKWSDLMVIAERAEAENVTLVFSAKDETHNQAVALKEMIRSRKTPRREGTWNSTGLDASHV